VLVSTQGGTAGTTVVRAFVSDAQLHTGVTSSWLVLGLLAVGLFGLGLVVADRMGRSLVRDIDDLAGTAHRLSGGDLTAQSGVSEPPELAEVGRALNTLGGRITDLLRAERERAADLSHRLRTPLTLLKLEVEAVDAGADRQRLGAAVAAVERGVDRVITEARRPTERAAPAICDAASVARERAAFWQPLAEDEGRLLRTDVVDRPVPVRVGADDLAAALDALIGNVFAHAGEDAGIMITVAVLAGDGATGTAEVTVSDTGPGIPADLASRGVSGAGSTGLGLDIAAGTARSAGGTMIIDVGDRGGTAVRLRLPVTDDPIEQDVVHRSSEQPDSRLG
jgi:signal transduction histidine kinase